MGRRPARRRVVQVQVVNEGTRTGRAKCELIALDAAGRVLREVSSISPSVSAVARSPPRRAHAGRAGAAGQHRGEVPIGRGRGLAREPVATSILLGWA